MQTTELPEHLQLAVNMRVPGLDIMHGELKNLMYETEQSLLNVSQSQDTPEYKYLSGRLDALTEIYVMTYNLAFALNERIIARG